VSETNDEVLARADADELAHLLEAKERASALKRETPAPPAAGDRLPVASTGGRALREVERGLRDVGRELEQHGDALSELRHRLGVQPAGDDEETGERSPLPRPTVPVTIIVPVHDAFDELRACVAALVRNTTAPAQLLFVDDASTDPRVARSLLDWREFAGVGVLRNGENRGFSATVNRGLRSTPGYDVVVLNSDTAVTPRWLERLISTAYSDPLIATVTPLSDNAGAFSVPLAGERNPVPAFLDDDDTSRLIAQESRMLRPGTPTANGFCMYVKRAAVDQVGYLDAAAFPRGYGEENDFCLRASEHGWRHVVDDRVFIHHVREASFGADKRALLEQGRAEVDSRHPQYGALVADFVDGDIARVRETVGAAYARARESYDRVPEARREIRPRILFVAHEGRGGTPATNLDLMLDLSSEYDCWLLSSTGQELRLAQISGGAGNDSETWRLEAPLSPIDFSRADYRRVVAEILDRDAFELIHIRHLFKHTFDLPSIAASRGIPVVLSFHDFYFVCPTVHLIDDQLHYCGGLCTPGPGTCGVPFDQVRDRLPTLKHRFVYEWRSEAQHALSEVDAFVTSSPHAREVHLSALPALEHRRFAVIEHGRDAGRTAAGAPPTPGGPVRIAVPGNLDLHKGAEFMRSVLSHDRSGRISFDLLGDIPRRYADLGRVHGPYERDEIALRLTEINPAFVGVFSIWPETYSHILSEAWSAGVPVLAAGLGALRERIERHGGGWLVDPRDPAAAVNTILGVADDPDAYERGRAGATSANVRAVAEMSADYSALYRGVIDRRRVFFPRRARSGRRHLGRGVLRADVVLAGEDGNYTGSTHTRLVGRLQHPSIRRKLQASLRDGNAISEIAPDRDLVIAQPTAVPPERVDEFIAKVADRGLPLVLDLDDDLFALGTDDVKHAQQSAGLRRLLSAADLVTVSTPVLERLVAGRGAATLLVENMIDERLFFASAPVAPRRPRSAHTPVRILYLGSPPDDDDLALLEPAFDRLRRDGVAVALDVVGGAPPDHRVSWYRSVPSPPGQDRYPQFIHWLAARRHQWDFALAPLAPTELNRSRSDLKFLEYAALGLPGVFSNLEPYASVQHGVTGMVVENQADAWYEAIAQLAESPQLRSELAERALGYVRGRRLLRHGADHLLSALFDLVAVSRSRD
jgi:O-antigen biosynthesis protein